VPPMTFGNMGAEGIRCLDVSCLVAVAGWFRVVLMALFMNRPVSSAITLLHATRTEVALAMPFCTLKR